VFHKKGTRQFDRDRIKDSILKKYNIPIIRFSTAGSQEEEKLRKNLGKLMNA
jgi:hypothetical protein